jgi:prevent-host-death family protein
MKSIDMKQATAALADYARQVEKEPVIVTEHGRPVAALIEPALRNVGTSVPSLGEARLLGT